MLEALGIHPQTAAAGHGTQASGVQRRGILLPAESVERLVKLALEAEEMMGAGFGEGLHDRAGWR